MNQILHHAIAVLAAVLSASCAHVRLEVPSRTAPSEVRRAAWERLRPSGVYEVTDAVGRRKLWTHSLVLVDGREVNDPAELLPAVAPDSRTATYVARFEERRRKWNVWGGIAASTFGLITVPFFVGIGEVVAGGVGSFSGRASPSPVAEVAFWSLYVTALVGPLVSLVIGAITAGNANADRDHAFESYPADLHRFLFNADEEGAPPAPP